MRGWVVCSFASADHLKGRARTYEAVKEAVLAAGRFSTFEVNTPKDAAIFTRLSSDPEIEVFDMPFPWTGVRRRASK